MKSLLAGFTGPTPRLPFQVPIYFVHSFAHPESTDPPPSTPQLYEPEEFPLLPGQPHSDDINYGSQQPHALLGALQDALQGREEKQRHRLRRQHRITEDFTYPTSNDATDSAVEQSTAAGHSLGRTIYSDSRRQHSWVSMTEICFQSLLNQQGFKYNDCVFPLHYTVLGTRTS